MLSSRLPSLWLLPEGPRSAPWKHPQRQTRAGAERHLGTWVPRRAGSERGGSWDPAQEMVPTGACQYSQAAGQACEGGGDSLVTLSHDPGLRDFCLIMLFWGGRLEDY